MKQLKYLSPTSISMWLEDRQEFYLKYLADDAPERFPQTVQMSVGSAFDAHVKSHLHRELVGDNNPKYDFENLFETQVEKHNRDFAKVAGLQCFKAYVKSGALADLMKVMVTGNVKFEFEVFGIINKHRDGYVAQVGDVVLLGKPDALFCSSGFNPDGTPKLNADGSEKKPICVVLDWKCNGYCANSPKSPTKGYSMVRDGWDFFEHNASRNANCCHADAMVVQEHGWDVNVATTMDKTDETWARQLSIYSWLCGAPVGGDFIVAIDQLCCSPGGRSDYEGMKADCERKIRVAAHRLRVSVEFQESLYRLAKHIWDTCKTDHIFLDLTKEQSQQKQASLDKMAETLKGDGTEKDQWFAKVARGITPA